MELLKRCQQWFEQNEIQKVIDALEAIPAGERTPELDSELAKAYIAIADIGEREPYEKALEAVKRHEDGYCIKDQDLELVGAYLGKKTDTRK